MDGADRFFVVIVALIFLLIAIGLVLSLL